MPAIDLTTKDSMFKCRCDYCGKVFLKHSKNRHSFIKNPQKQSFCNSSCHANFRFKRKNVECSYCGKKFFKESHRMNSSKSGRHFCSNSCSAIYNNTHKSTGTRRSKLEIWLESQLNELFPSLEILFNNKDRIGSELDIFIPYFNIAFELNGIFHYKPIYGEEKLLQIHLNDTKKLEVCEKLGITLHHINTSDQEKFTTKSSKKYLEYIVNIINDSDRD